MTIYEKRRQQLRAAQDAELDEVMLQKDSVSEKEYWAGVAAVYKKYAELLAEVDSAERQKAALVAAKEHTQIDKRPELDYASILGQLKASKESELLMKLSQLDTDVVNAVNSLHIDVKDPFYLDKKDPLIVFHRWWDEFVQKLPSVDEVKTFLKSIDISDSGAIYYKNEEASAPIVEKDFGEVEGGYLSAEKLKSSRIKKREAKQERARVARLRRPGMNFINTPSKKDPKDTYTALRNVVDGYELSEQLSDVLYEHIEKCCIPKGLVHVDKYTHMLEQFLRNVPEEKQVSTVVVAILRGWRCLYYVN